MAENRRVAVFIDAENISADFSEKILSEASNYGDVIIKRVFGDWSSPLLSSWKNKVGLLSLKPEQQFPAVKGKNASDISLIINAMTVLFEKDIDVFCLASSDSDFTRLVQELRERQKQVVGFGNVQTNFAFVNSFSEFIYLNKPEPVKETVQKGKTSSKKAEKQEKSIIPHEKMRALKEIIETLIEQNGKALYGTIGIEMKNRFSDFIPKNYGSKTMKEFILRHLKSIGNYEVKTSSDGTTMYIVPKSK